ncbi:unnamed protein product [Triticum turgidum subsp. durum]|uniref:Glutaredoxin domain-containing protein n=1 Tax=Triticum turgidum subsp. durum TaxID=4567 RepID=A0A9R0SM92_TRITD|nr:unnamed protein product [Triticum turgidum subsp. durum]
MTDLESITHMLQWVVPFASPPAVEQLGRALWGLGSLTLVLALTTVLHQPAAGPVFAHYKAAYYTVLAFVLFVAVPVELGSAFCLPRCSHGRRIHHFARVLVPCAYLLLLVVISVGLLFLEVSLVPQGNEASGYELTISLSHTRSHNFQMISTDVLPKQHSTCKVGFPQRGFFHTVVQFLCSLDVLVSDAEALRQGFNEYSSWPTWPQHCIDGEFFCGATSLSCPPLQVSHIIRTAKGVLCFLVYRGHNFQVVCIDVLPKQRSTFLVGYPQCGFSHMVVQVLWLLVVPFETLNVLADEALQQWLKEYSSWHTSPQLYIEFEFFRGCDITVVGLECTWHSVPVEYMLSAFPSPMIMITVQNLTLL